MSVVGGGHGGEGADVRVPAAGLDIPRQGVVVHGAGQQPRAQPHHGGLTQLRVQVTEAGPRDSGTSYHII